MQFMPLHRNSCFPPSVLHHWGDLGVLQFFLWVVPGGIREDKTCKKYGLCPYLQHPPCSWGCFTLSHQRYCLHQFTSHTSWTLLTDVLLCFISACQCLCPISPCRYLCLLNFGAKWLPSVLSIVMVSRKIENLPFVWLVFVVHLKVTLFPALYTPRLWLYFIVLLYFRWLCLSPKTKLVTSYVKVMWILSVYLCYCIYHTIL